MVSEKHINNANSNTILEIAKEIYKEEMKQVRNKKMKKKNCTFRNPPKRVSHLTRNKIKKWYHGEPEIPNGPNHTVLEVLSNVLPNKNKLKLLSTTKQWYQTPQVQNARNRLYKEHIAFMKLKNVMNKILRKIEKYKENPFGPLRLTDNETILYFLFTHPGFQPQNSIITNNLPSNSENSNNNMTSSKQSWLNALNVLEKHGYVEKKMMIKPVTKYNVVYNSQLQQFVPKVQNKSPKLYYKLKFANKL